MLQVEREAALPAVDGEKISAFAADKWRAPSAGVVALLRLFYLDDVGAGIGEGLRAVRPGEDPGEVDDLDARERLRQW
jgi:hypothetical protein